MQPDRVSARAAGWLRLGMGLKVMRSLIVSIPLLILAGCAAPAPQARISPTLKVEISDSPLTLKFINAGNQPVRILKPLDGSESCWIMPYYKLTVTDERENEIPLSPRCGNYYFYWHTIWPDDYLITIPPGGSYSRRLPLFHDIPVSGTYQLCFHYIFEPKTKWAFDKRYPKHLWHGEAISNIIETHLEKVKLE
jgi:hypothetical protein